MELKEALTSSILGSSLGLSGSIASCDKQNMQGVMRVRIGTKDEPRSRLKEVTEGSA